MTWLLVSLLGAVTVAFVTLTFLNRKDNRETLAARELALGKDKQIAELESELATVKDKLKKETARLGAVDALLDEAFAKGVEHVVERVQGANVADANKIIGEVLASMPTRRGAERVPKAVPEGRATAPGPDSLIDPFAVQPPRSP